MKFHDFNQLWARLIPKVNKWCKFSKKINVDVVVGNERSKVQPNWVISAEIMRV